MNTPVSRQLMLEGLECGFCAARISSEIGQVSGVTEASFDISTSTISIKTFDDADIDKVISRINEIISFHEHEIMIREKIISKPERKVLLMTGLSCAHCAAAIEKSVAGIPGVKAADIDFAAGRLRLETESGRDLNRIVKEAARRASRIEAGVRIVPNKGEETHASGRIKLIITASAAAVFFVALLLPLPETIRISLFFTSYLAAGWSVLFRAFRNILSGRIFDENFLMTIATIGAAAIGEYPEAVAVMLFYQVGSILQDMAVNRSRKSVKALLSLLPDFARVIVGTAEKQVSPEEVEPGDLIAVWPGERVPLDGIVEDGYSGLDVAALTGESVIKDAGPGTEVLSGSVNLGGLLKIRVKKRFSDSAVSRILALVEDASSRKAPTELFITKFASKYTPSVVAAALLLALLPPLLSDQPFSVWINRALIFLVVSCPCALVVSIPLSFFAGIGVSSVNGILVKGSNYLEALNDIDTVVFDKTGTLTKGEFEVEKEVPYGTDAETLLEMAAYAEAYSSHPVARSLLRAYGREPDRTKIEKYDEIYGNGVKALVSGKEIVAGSAAMLQRQGIVLPEPLPEGVQVHVSVDGVYSGYLLLSDMPRDDARKTVDALRKAGVKHIAMMTGDGSGAGARTAAILGLDSVYSGLLPAGKLDALEKVINDKKTKGSVVFVGDGINDAPALARADIGVAVADNGAGTGAALEAGDIVLLDTGPYGLVKAIRIAKETRKVVWTNIALALTVKVLVLALGAAGLARMWEAVFADVGVTLLAVFNSLRIMRIKGSRRS